MRALLASLLLFSGAALGATPETRLSGVFQAIEANRLDDALRRVDALIVEHPNFRLSNVMRKRQYWVKEGPGWKIIYEGSG